nr:MAG TPA: hypothetical protein [Caudoviricetes sp.]
MYKAINTIKYISYIPIVIIDVLKAITSRSQDTD